MARLVRCRLLATLVAIAASSGVAYPQPQAEEGEGHGGRPGGAPPELLGSVALAVVPADATVRLDRVEPAIPPGERADTNGPVRLPEPISYLGHSRFPGATTSRIRIDELPAGRFELDVERLGFRSYRAVVQLPDPRHYDLGRVVLERAEAALALVDLPDGAVVTVDGDLVEPDRSRTPPRIRLHPGTWTLSVTDGTNGHFETSVTAADRRLTEVDIALRPALAFLGVLGGDTAGERAMDAALDALRREGSYAVLHSADRVAEALGSLGVEAAALRGDVDQARRDLDWSGIRERIEAEAPARLYLLAIPNRERDADRIDLWWWAAAPGPARPDVRALAIRDGEPDAETLGRLVSALRPELPRRRPVIGASVIESLAADSLVVAAVEPGSPAERAGLEAGMELSAQAPASALTALDWRAAVAALEPGETLAVHSRSEGGASTEHRIEPEWGWNALDGFRPEWLASMTASHLLQELERPGDVPPWLVELDLAAVLFAHGDAEGAARRLREIDAPKRRGLGRETVNYMIGLALSDLAERGDSEYGDQAIAAFRGLELADGGRLGSDGGPSIATRARLHAKTSLTLVPPESEVVVGEYRADVQVSGSDIVAVRFLVDGSLQTTQTRPQSWAVLRLAKYPTQQVVRVEGLNAEGKVVASDELVLNQQHGDLRVRIEEPPPGVDLAGPVTAKAAVVVPKGRKVVSVTFEVGDEVQAEIVRPPWRAEIDVPDTTNAAAPTFLAAIATLDDGSKAEDVRFLGASLLTDHVDVDLVELYTTVIDQANRPVTALEEADFTVYEDGKRQEIAKFERVENLPLTLGVAIDTSDSMAEVMRETRRAATRFLASLIQPGDTSFAVAFASRPRLLMGQTADVEAVINTVSALRPSGRTALHDALMTSLYHFRGVRGRRALVLLSDGEDTSSSAQYEDVLEYAKHSEIVIYTIGMGVGSQEDLLRAKLQEIAGVTGGRAFFIAAARDLGPAYRDIEREIRSQYLLAYTSNQDDSSEEFRQVEVRVTGDREARAISGYYP